MERGGAGAMIAAAPNELALAVGVLSALGSAGLFTYGLMVAQIRRDGGAVQVHTIAFPEAAFALLLGGWFALLVWNGFSAPVAKTVTEQGMVSGAVTFGMVVMVLWTLLKVRRQRLRELFGLNRAGPGMVIGTAIGLLLAAFPIIAAVNLGVQQLVPAPERTQQEIVQFFIEAHQRGDTRAVIMTFLLGVLVAPLFEEFIFRGFLYSVAKRYLGMGTAMVLVALLFSAVHLNLSALPGLALLSVCFTIANEKTGSLFTSMLMHAMFNATSLVALMYAPHLGV